MRILILGKNGQVGWELQRSLAPLGGVIALGRAEADLESPSSLKAAIDRASPEIIVNASAYTAVDKAESEPERADRINHLAVGEIGELAAARDAWVIHYSTDYVFDGTKTSPYLETDPTCPISVYGRTKRDGEVALGRSGVRHLIFRTSWVHAGRGSNFVRTMLRLAAERDSLRVVVDQTGVPTSAEFIADVTAHAVARVRHGEPVASGIYNLTSSGETSWHGLARFSIAEALSMGARLKVTSDAIAAIKTSEYPTPAARPLNSRLDNSKLLSAFGLEAPDWRYHARRSVIESLQVAS